MMSTGNGLDDDCDSVADDDVDNDDDSATGDNLNDDGDGVTGDNNDGECAKTTTTTTTTMAMGRRATKCTMMATSQWTATTMVKATAR